MGIFDDLIPQQAAPPTAPSGGDMFADLIPQPQTTTVADIAKGAASGVARGLIGMGGTPGDLVDLGSRAATKLGLPQSVGQAVARASLLPIDPAAAFGRAPTSQDLTQDVEAATGPLYQPQTVPGKYAETAGEFLPAALGPAGDMGIGARLLKMVAAPAIASETAGELTQGTAAEPYARAGAAFLAPLVGGVARSTLAGKPVTTIPRNVTNVAGVDVPLSAGQTTGDTTAQILENASLRGARGQPAQQAAEQFFTGRQAPAVEQARSAIGRTFDPLGMQIAQDPLDAAELASSGIRSAALTAKQGYRSLYNEALSFPGEFNAATFEGVGQKIKGALSLSQNPVIIDDVTTPVASKAIQHIDNTIGQLRIQNRADPFGQPNPENIVGVNLQGVDQARKQLINMASATERGTADHRAMTRIVGAFDDQVQNSIENGLFSGDDRALDAIKDARQAYSNYRQTFTKQGAGDDVGAAMEKIIGRNGNDGATPTEVANYLYGNAKIGSSGLSVRLAQRLQNVLGSQSPEWAAIRQGIWSRLTEAPEGVTAYGPQKVASRLGEFLNGSGRPLAQVMFAPSELALMDRYAGLQRQLIPKTGTVNYSNSGVLLSALKGTANSLATMFGAAVGGPVGALAGYAAGPLGRKLQENMAARALNRSLYTTTRQSAPVLSGNWKQRALINAALGVRGGQMAAQPQ